MEGKEHWTSLRGEETVRKDHPRIVLRGKLDTFGAQTMLLQHEAAKAGEAQLAQDLGEIAALCGLLMRAEVLDEPLGAWKLFGLTPAQLRERSHHTQAYYGVGFLQMDAEMEPFSLKLNLLRAQSREMEIAAVAALDEGHTMLLEVYNRLSSAIYILMCQRAGEK